MYRHRQRVFIKSLTLRLVNSDSYILTISKSELSREVGILVRR